MELRCKVFRSAGALELEQAINRFLTEELSSPGEVQFEEITQSESAAGVTVVLWYSRASTQAESIEERYEELDELDGGQELA
jgi:hypothetical protein